MTTSIEVFHTNKRKFISDLEVSPPLARTFSNVNQVESSCNPKKLKADEFEPLPTPTFEVEENDHMMICENSSSKATDKSSPVVVPKHCNGICNADASPPTFIRRCYCDPYRLNGLVPYHSDIY